MDKGIIKMMAIVTVIAVTLLIGSICIATHYGSMMLQSSINSAEETNTDSGTGNSNSSNSINQKSTSPRK